MSVRKKIPDIQFKGLDEDVVHLLQQSIVHMVRMRRSIESTDKIVERSMLVAFESRELLKRLRYNGL